MKRKLILTLTIVGISGCDTLVTRNDLRENESRRQVQELQKSTADVGNRFADIEQDLRNLNGRIEVVEARLNQNSQDSMKSRSQTEQSAQDQNRRILVLQEELAKLHEQVGSMAAELNALRSAPSDAPAVKDRETKGSLDVAAENFARKDWRKAIVGYQKFRENNPKSKKIPEATLNIGVCFQELGLQDEARTFYEEVISKFPNSSEAKKAKGRLKSLKK